MENNTKKKGFKPWMANLIAFILDAFIIIIYFVLCKDAISSILEGNLSGGFDDIISAIWFLNIAILVVSILYLAIKPMRTKINIGWATWNIVWVVGNIYLMYS